MSFGDAFKPMNCAFHCQYSLIAECSPLQVAQLKRPVDPHTGSNFGVETRLQLPGVWV